MKKKIKLTPKQPLNVKVTPKAKKENEKVVVTPEDLELRRKAEELKQKVIKRDPTLAHPTAAQRKLVDGQD